MAERQFLLQLLASDAKNAYLGVWHMAFVWQGQLLHMPLSLRQSGSKNCPFLSLKGIQLHGEILCACYKHYYIKQNVKHIKADKIYRVFIRCRICYIEFHHSDVMVLGTPAFYQYIGLQCSVP